MGELAAAFAPPHVRASASRDVPLPDRISLRDYVKSVDIGAFASERGVRQRLRFNIVLEVVHGPGGCEDDVDKVLSYDTITDAVEAALAAERVNLLETLAERVAAQCLSDPRAVRAFVRVEKLERGPGALGVEIVRDRSMGLSRIGPVPDRPPIQPVAPKVIHLPRFLLEGQHRSAWLDAVAGLGRPAIVVLDPLVSQRPARNEAELRIGLLSIEQAAWSLVADDARFSVAASRTEMDWALRGGRPIAWAPGKLVLDATARPQADAANPPGLARWLANVLHAEELVLAGAPDGAVRGAGERRLDAAAPARLSGSD